MVSVDASSKSSFASRLAHSCEANCIHYVIGHSGQYRSVLKAAWKILCGEELTYDYMAITDDKQEEKEAVCLCGK